jgi:integrase
MPQRAGRNQVENLVRPVHFYRMRNVTSKGPRSVFPARFHHLVPAPHRQRRLGSDIRIRDPNSAAGVRTAWLTNHCRAVLTRWRAMFGPDSSPYVFPSSRVPETQMTDYKGAWRKAAAAAGLKDRRIYDLRLTFASRASSCRASGHTVAQLLGHANHTNPCPYVRPIDSTRKPSSTPSRPRRHAHTSKATSIQGTAVGSSEVKPVHK